MPAAAKPNPEPSPQPDPQPRGLGRASLDNIQLATLRGDIKDVILQEMRDSKNALPWTTRTEAQQREMIDRADSFSRNLVARVVEAVAARDFPAIHAKIDKWTVDSKGLKVLITAHAGPANLQAMMEGGNLAHLIFADTEELQGERESIKPLPDQGQLLDPEDEPPPGEGDKP